VLIVTWLHWASAARIAAELVAAGVNVDVVCSAFHPILSITGVSRRYRYAPMSPLQSLARAIERSAPDLIVACDDVVIGHLQSLRGAGRQELAELIEHSLGPAESYEIIASRARFIALAQTAGLDAPDCAEVATAVGLKERLREFGTPAFLKADGTHGGQGVRRVREADDADAVFASMQPTPDFFGDGLPRRAPVLSVHKAITGQPANCCAFAWRGEVAAVVSVVTQETLHTFGVATVVRPVENAAMRHAAEVIARKLKLSGFFGLDFILQADGERAWVLELNPRPTPISHFALGAGRDLVAVLIAALGGRPQVERPVVFRLDSSVRVFPHLLRHRGGGETQLQEDWPVGQPQLIRAFARRRKLADYRNRICDWLGLRNSTAVPVHRSESTEMAGI
jgi:predicted ATP-grasp superfamily ATP-dependent carboligase